MEFVIKFIVVVMIMTVIIGLFVMSIKDKHEVEFENRNKKIKKTFQVKVENDIGSKRKETQIRYIKSDNDNKNNNMLIQIFGAIGVVAITILILTKLISSNPVIGKWRSETNYSFMGKSVNEVEFTSDSEYALGMRFKVKYEIDGNRVIVTDETGIGTVFEVIDKNTIRSNALGFETILRRI